MKTYKCWFSINNEGSVYLYCTKSGFKSNVVNHCVSCVAYAKGDGYLSCLRELSIMNEKELETFVIKELERNGVIKSDDVIAMLNKISSIKISVKR